MFHIQICEILHTGKRGCNAACAGAHGMAEFLYRHFRRSGMCADAEPDCFFSNTSIAFSNKKANVGAPWNCCELLYLAGPQISNFSEIERKIANSSK